MKLKRYHPDSYQGQNFMTESEEGERGDYTDYAAAIEVINSLRTVVEELVEALSPDAGHGQRILALIDAGHVLKETAQ